MMYLSWKRTLALVHCLNEALDSNTGVEKY